MEIDWYFIVLAFNWRCDFEFHTQAVSLKDVMFMSSKGTTVEAESMNDVKLVPWQYDCGVNAALGWICSWR